MFTIKYFLKNLIKNKTKYTQSLIIYYKMNILVTKIQIKKQNFASPLEILYKSTNLIKLIALLTFIATAFL